MSKIASHKEYEILSMKGEYGEETLGFRNIVVTDLPEKCLKMKYENDEILQNPYVIVSREIGQAIAEFHRNEWKHAMRAMRNTDYYGTDPGILYRGLVMQDEAERRLETKELFFAVFKDMKDLTEKQRSILMRYCIGNQKMQEIAQADHISIAAVSKTLERARERMQKSREGRDALES